MKMAIPAVDWQSRFNPTVEYRQYRERSEPTRRWNGAPMISVLVAAWNEADRIEQHIASFRNLEYSCKELILCAGGSDDTYQRAKRYEGDGVVVLLQLPGEGKQRALQHCLAHANGSIVHLTDADCMYSNDAFERLLRPVIEGVADVVTGVSEPLPDQREGALIQYQWYRDRDYARHLPETTHGVLGRNCALRRSVLERIGGFNTPARTGTDYVLSRLILRAGYEIHTVPESSVPSEFPATPGAYLNMWRRWNKNLIVQGARHGNWGDVRSITIAAGVYSMIPILPVFSKRIGPVAVIGPATLFIVAILNRFGRLKAGARDAGKGLTTRNIATLPLFTVLDMLAVLLAVFDAILPGRRSRW